MRTQHPSDPVAGGTAWAPRLLVAVAACSALLLAGLPAPPAQGHPGPGGPVGLDVSAHLLGLTLIPVDPTKPIEIASVGRENYRLVIDYEHGNLDDALRAIKDAEFHGRKLSFARRNHWTRDSLEIPFAEGNWYHVGTDELGHITEDGLSQYSGSSYRHFQCSPRTPLVAHLYLYEDDMDPTLIGVVIGVVGVLTAAAVAVGSKGTLSKPAVGIGAAAMSLAWTVMTSAVGEDLLASGSLLLDDGQRRGRLAAPPSMREKHRRAWNVHGAEVAFNVETRPVDPHPDCDGYEERLEEQRQVILDWIETQKTDTTTPDPFSELFHYAEQQLLEDPFPKFTDTSMQFRKETLGALAVSLAGMQAGLVIDSVSDRPGAAEAVELFEDARRHAGEPAIERYRAAYRAGLAAWTEDPVEGLDVRLPAQLLVPGRLVAQPDGDAELVGAVFGVDPGDVEQVTVSGAPAGMSVEALAGTRLQGLVLAGELAADLPAGMVVGLERVEGAVLTGPTDTCPAEHVTGEAVTVDGQGPYVAPSGPCGFGVVHTTDGHLHAGAAPADATFDEGFRLRLSFDDAELGAHTLTVGARLSDGRRVDAPLTVFVDRYRATARFIHDACPQGEIGDSTFDDVPATSVHAHAIDCVAARGITAGTAPGSYSPAALTRRDQMASFLVRLIESQGATLPANPPDAFADDDGSVHETAINRLAAAGVVRGTGPGTYDPRRVVSRAQMATFLDRAFTHVAGQALPDEVDFFSDTAGSVHADAINAVAGAGIAAGTGPGLYEPDGPTRRDQMASFLARLLDRLIVGTASDGDGPEPAPGHALTVQVHADSGTQSSEHVEVVPDKDRYATGEQVTLTAAESFESGGYQHYFGMWMVEPEVPHEYEGTTLWVTMEGDVTATAYYEAVPVEANSVHGVQGRAGMRGVR